MDLQLLPCSGIGVTVPDRRHNIDLVRCRLDGQLPKIEEPMDILLQQQATMPMVYSARA